MGIMAALTKAGVIVVAETVVWAFLGALIRVIMAAIFDAETAEFGYALSASIVAGVTVLVLSNWLAAIIFVAEIGGLYWLAGKA